MADADGFLARRTRRKNIVLTLGEEGPRTHIQAKQKLSKTNRRFKADVMVDSTTDYTDLFISPSACMGRCHLENMSRIYSIYIFKIYDRSVILKLNGKLRSCHAWVSIPIHSKCNQRFNFLHQQIRRQKKRFCNQWQNDTLKKAAENFTWDSSTENLEKLIK